jgi:hypothetical protein
LPVEQLQTFRERVNVVTPDEVQRVSRMYLKPERLSVVLVGNAGAFVSQLRAIGLSQIETIELDDLDLLAVDFRRAGSSAGDTTGARAAADGGALDPSKRTAP